MDIIFLGGVYPRHLEKEIIENSKGNIDFAANNLQWAIIDGLDICNRDPINIINLMFIQSFPNGYKKVIVKTKAFSHKNGSSDINIGFINLPVIKLFHRLIAGTVNISRRVKRNGKYNIIVIYAIHTPFLLASVLVKFIYKNTKLCLIVPDLPQFMSESRNPIYIIFKAIDKIIIYKTLKKIDAFVLLSDYMAEKLEIKQRPWIRMEGIFNGNRYNFRDDKNADKVIMYSGKLDTTLGILDLLNAFALLKDQNYRLWITGNGNAINFIVNASQADGRIKYWYPLNQNEIYKLQQEATLLVNPLRSDHQKATYSFPSKTMEYMASGTPVLMHKLPCIPDDYRQFLFFWCDANIENMKNRIVELCEKSENELNDFGKSAKEFILKNKNPEAQCRKIFTLLNELPD